MNRVMETTPARLVYRCETDGKLLRESDVLSGEHLGHRIKYASEGSFWEYLKIAWWKWVGTI